MHLEYERPTRIEAAHLLGGIHTPGSQPMDNTEAQLG